MERVSNESFKKFAKPADGEGSPRIQPRSANLINLNNSNARQGTEKDGTGRTPVDPYNSTSQRGAHGLEEIAGNRAWENGIGEQFETYRSLLFTTVARMVGPDAAQDITQEVAITAFTHQETLDTSRNLRAWFLQVATNRAIDVLRRRNHRNEIPLESQNDGDDPTEAPAYHLQDRSPLPEEAVVLNEASTQLQEAIAALSPKFRRVVELRYFYDFSYNEIANRLNIPAGTAKTYYHRALPILRASFEGLRQELTR